MVPLRAPPGKPSLAPAPVSTPTLRHCFATHLLEDKVDIRVIRVLLGHSRLDTTARHAQVASTTPRAIKSPLAWPIRSGAGARRASGALGVDAHQQGRQEQKIRDQRERDGDRAQEAHVGVDLEPGEGHHAKAGDQGDRRDP